MVSTTRPRLLATSILATLLCGLPLRGQAPCDDRGTVLRPASVEAGPPLGCEHAPDAPAFHLFAPEFHDTVPRLGWRLVAARTRPRLIARYRCTGFWLLPVVLRDVAVYGYVLDVTATPCGEGAAPTPPG